MHFGAFKNGDFSDLLLKIAPSLWPSTGSANSKWIFWIWYFRYLELSHNRIWYLKFSQTCGHLTFCNKITILFNDRTRTMIFVSVYNGYYLQRFCNLSPFYSHFVVWTGSIFQTLAQNLLKNEKFHKASNFDVRCTTSENQGFGKSNTFLIFVTYCLNELTFTF